MADKRKIMGRCRLCGRWHRPSACCRPGAGISATGPVSPDEQTRTMAGLSPDLLSEDLLTQPMPRAVATPLAGASALLTRTVGAGGAHSGPVEGMGPGIPPVLGKYRVLRELGRGGMGIVLMAHDEIDDRMVALKLIPVSKVDRPRLLRFMREFRAVKKLDHPNVIRVYDADFHEDRPYFTMEFVDGDDLRKTVNKKWAGGGTAEFAQDLEAVLAIFRQTAAALGHIHSRGMIHRDLKPDNIMVEKSGRAKLMDFGLVKELGEDLEQTQVGIVVGTAAYMAPEQILGLRDLDGRVDFYALGVALYEVLAGQRPYGGPSVMAVIQKHLKGEPPPLRRFAPWIEADLEKLVVDLMARERQNRPATGEEIMVRIDHILSRGEGLVLLFDSDVIEVLVPAFVGHDGFDSWLEELLDQAVFGCSGACGVLVEGGSGMGKSRYLEEVGKWARMEILPVVHVVCREEARAPFSAFAPFLASLGSQVGGLSREKKQELAPVAALVPALREVLGAEEGVSAEKALPAAVNLVAEALGAQPMVLLIDDVHWIDELSLDFLEKLFAWEGNLPLIVALGYRPDEVSTSHRLRSLPGQVAASRLRVQKLEPFEHDFMAALVASALGVGPGDLSSELVVHVAAKARGCPMLALQALRRLVGVRGIIRVAGKIVLRGVVRPEIQPEDETKEILLTQETQAVPREDLVAREIQELVAIFGRGVPVELLLELTRWAEAELLDALNNLLQRRTLRRLQEQGEKFEFVQQAFRAGIYESIPQDRRRELHGRIARFLEGQANAEDCLEAIAHHFRQAHEIVLAMDYLKKCVNKATRLYAHRDCIRLAAEALELSGHLPEGRERWLLEFDLVGCQSRSHYCLAEFHEALRVAHIQLDLARRTREPRHLLGARNNLGVLCGKVGEFQAAREHYEAALEHAKNSSVAHFQGAILGNLAVIYQRLASTGQTRELLAKAVEASRRAGNVEFEASVLINLARQEMMNGNIQNGRRCLERLRELARIGNIHEKAARTDLLWGCWANVTGDWNRAQQLWMKALPHLRHFGDEHWLQWTLLYLADLAIRRGFHDVAEKRLAELSEDHNLSFAQSLTSSTSLEQRLQEPKLRANYLRLKGELALARNEWSLAIPELRELAAREVRVDPMEPLGAKLALARVLGAVGEIAEAISCLEDVISNCRKFDVVLLHTPACFHQLSLQMEAGQPPSQLLEKLECLIREAEARQERHWLVRLQIRRLVVKKDPADAAWAEALAFFEHQQARVDWAETLLLQAEVALDCGLVQRGREILRVHQSELLELGIPWYQLWCYSLLSVAESSERIRESRKHAKELLGQLASQLDGATRNQFLMRPAIRTIRMRLRGRC